MKSNIYSKKHSINEHEVLLVLTLNDNDSGLRRTELHIDLTVDKVQHFAALATEGKTNNVVWFLTDSSDFAKCVLACLSGLVLDEIFECIKKATTFQEAINCIREKFSLNDISLDVIKCLIACTGAGF